MQKTHTVAENSVKALIGHLVSYIVPMQQCMMINIGVGAGPADQRLPDQCFYANAPPPLPTRIVHGHTVCKHGTCRICLTNVHETATPLINAYISERR